jgi:Caspase domain
MKTEPVEDNVDAKSYADADAKPQRSNFLSTLLGTSSSSPTKPGHEFPSRPTNERYYDFTHKNLGIAIIFNQIKVKGEGERKGSEKDAKDLHKVLTHIGFNVQVLTDFTTKEIKDNLLASEF